jgi:hypothetical protein
VKVEPPQQGCFTNKQGDDYAQEYAQQKASKYSFTPQINKVMTMFKSMLNRKQTNIPLFHK